MLARAVLDYPAEAVTEIIVGALAPQQTLQWVLEMTRAREGLEVRRASISGKKFELNLRKAIGKTDRPRQIIDRDFSLAGLTNLSDVKYNNSI